jgi:hypothetical protein
MWVEEAAEAEMDSDELLEQSAGEWEGEYRLWMKPADEPDAQSPTRATITRELGGRGLLLRYDWRFDEDAHEGLAIIMSNDEGVLQMGWSDTFHSGGGVMHNEGIATEAKVLAHYGPVEAPWGWRTEFEMPSRDELEIRAYNILPDGLEALATEARYRRVS